MENPRLYYDESLILAVSQKTTEADRQANNHFVLCYQLRCGHFGVLGDAKLAALYREILKDWLDGRIISLAGAYEELHRPPS